MGRSNPTYRDALRAIEAEWRDFRRALRRRDEPHFDRLFEHAREYADAGGYRNHDDPVVTVLVSVCLGQQREIAGLRARVAELEAYLEDRPPTGQDPPWRAGGGPTDLGRTGGPRGPADPGADDDPGSPADPGDPEA